jgi:hypothetical protein
MEKIIEVNCQTGDAIERDMTQEEFNVWQEGVNFENQQQSAKASALAKLQSLGLTEDEINAIIS